MKNNMTHKRMIFFGMASFILSLLVFRVADAASINIMKDAELRDDKQLRCVKSQERTEALIKSANNRIEFEANKYKAQLKVMAQKHDDELVSYEDFVYIDSTQSMTDVEEYLQKISQRLDLIGGQNICTGISDNSRLADRLLEASRKLHETYATLKDKVKST